MEVKVNYLKDGQVGAVSVFGDDYETARGQAFELAPEGAVRISNMEDRER